MRYRMRPFMVIGFTVLFCLGPAVLRCGAQQIKIEGLFPRQLPRGQVSLINVAVPSRDAIQAIEISPSAGVKVSGIKLGQNFQGALTWSELSIDVAEDAAPGDRTIVLMLPAGRTIPATITIPNHVPSISALRVLPAQLNQRTIELQFTVVDTSADVGNSPYVWFMIGCNSELLPGVVHGMVTFRDKSDGVVRALIPGLPTTAGNAIGNSKCDVQVRITDSNGIESNTLKTTVDFKN